MTAQQGDVLLFQTNNDGDIIVENGIVEMSPGLETAAYVSLFGGNEDDDGSQDNKNTWWANLNETRLDKKYVSETQYLLKSLIATTGNLRSVEDAAKRDLQWFIDDNIASSIEVEATMPALNQLKLTIEISAEGEETRFEFTQNWKASL